MRAEWFYLAAAQCMLACRNKQAGELDTIRYFRRAINWGCLGQGRHPRMTRQRRRCAARQ